MQTHRDICELREGAKTPPGGEGERYSLNFKKLLQFLINYYKSKNTLNCAALSKLVQTLTKYFETVPNSVKIQTTV